MLMLEIHHARRRFGLPDDRPVISCYEAGRDGFWLHRYLEHQGIENLVVGAASIEVNRRQRRAKSDNLDATKLVSMLIRWHLGEKKLWAVVRVPLAADEDLRQLHRELIALKAQRTEHTNRIKGLLAELGLSIVIDAELPVGRDGLRQWDGTGVPSGMRGRILREFERQLVGRQIHDLEDQRTQQIRDRQTPQGEPVRLLLKLKGIGENSAWLLVREFFGWRGIRNRRELASLAGLTPTPYDSGESRREQGISKAGNRRVRWMMIELAWGWLRYQPNSELSQWYQRRFGEGNTRLRKVGSWPWPASCLWRCGSTWRPARCRRVRSCSRRRSSGARATHDGSRRESDGPEESAWLEGGNFELASAVNHERTGLEGATENGSGCPVREPWVRWARFPSPGFESSVDERSK
jgi:transposase